MHNNLIGVLKMNDEKLTYILLIIASLFLILNGVFAFEHNLVIILMSIFFILIGIILLIISIRLFLKRSSNN
ncbi:hypothetical protein BUZ22_02375 [Staphylococcus haemolyticus]|nr:hypothetical protein F1592_09695 [Staphylococcus sp. GDX7P312P]KAA2278723.1 hypothetical protein F1591_10520 [Staphylococcus sp. GDX7P459A]MWF62855.1 hypothetical protein [Staphylococcus haemolyticus]PTK41219.1 hypothetical protein BUZ38_05420 [Staphylococcus haemolyticus]PTK50888.1 hypothetical protein BUZ43_01460 [Staphylococcus haemolyticus]